jgi:uncharacterized membrane protein
MLNSFDPRTVLLAKHAQHVVLVHFPIALYLSGTFFDGLAGIRRNSSFSEVARWNFLSAAIISLPTAVTGVLAWRWALEGQRLKGPLRLHLLLAIAVVVCLWATIYLRTRRNSATDPRSLPGVLAFELVVCLLVTATAHLGGLLSGVNAGP